MYWCLTYHFHADVRPLVQLILIFPFKLLCQDILGFNDQYLFKFTHYIFVIFFISFLVRVYICMWVFVYINFFSLFISLLFFISLPLSSPTFLLPRFLSSFFYRTSFIIWFCVVLLLINYFFLSYKIFVYLTLELMASCCL